MNKNWLDILFVIVGIYFLEGAIRGAFYSSGRGGNRPLFVTLKWAPLRFASALLALGLFAFAIRDFLQRTRLLH
jgi:hypothetical protein